MCRVGGGIYGRHIAEGPQRGSNYRRGARSARADARLCTSSGINLIVPLSFHLVR